MIRSWTVTVPATMPRADSLEEKTQSFLREFFAKGESLVRDLIEENDRLRARARDADSSPVEVAIGDGVTTQVVQLVQLVQRVGSLERELDEVRRLAGRAEVESGGHRERMRSLEQEHHDLACMYVAGTQYQVARSLDEVLQTTVELLLNFVGVGRFAIYAVDEAREVLFPVACEGPRIESLAELRLDDPIVARAISLRRPWQIGDVEVRAEGELLVLPLFSDERLLGLIRLGSFLSHKRVFAPNDKGLLALISEHAGGSLEVAWLRAHAPAVPLRRETVESLLRP